MTGLDRLGVGSAALTAVSIALWLWLRALERGNDAVCGPL